MSADVENNAAKRFQSGRVHCEVFLHTWADGSHEYLLETFYWSKPTPRSAWRKLHRIARSDLQDLAAVLEAAEAWCQGKRLPRERVAKGRGEQTRKTHADVVNAMPERTVGKWAKGLEEPDPDCRSLSL